MKSDFASWIARELRALVLNQLKDEQHSNQHHRMMQSNFPSPSFGSMAMLTQRLTKVQFASMPAAR